MKDMHASVHCHSLETQTGPNQLKIISKKYKLQNID